MVRSRRVVWLFALAFGAATFAAAQAIQRDDSQRWISAASLAGAPVVDASGARVARIEEILLDPETGEAGMIVLNLLGEGRRLGVPWSAFSFGEGEILLVAAEMELRNAVPLDESPGQRRLAPYRAFDPATVITFQGVVVGVVEAPLGEGEVRDELAIVQTSAGSRMLSLAPDWYLDQEGIHLAPDERVRVTGSRLESDLGEVIAVSEIEIDGRRVRLRSSEGTPLWRR